LFIDLLPSRVNNLLKLSERYHIGRLFWLILSTIRLSDFHAIIITLIIPYNAHINRYYMQSFPDCDLIKKSAGGSSGQRPWWEWGVESGCSFPTGVRVWGGGNWGEST